MSEKQTAKSAVEILCRADAGFRKLKPDEKVRLSTVFARKKKVLYGMAFDLIKCQSKVDFHDENDIARNLKSIMVYEIKSTSRGTIPENFAGYFFDLTTAELLVAQSLGEQYKFAFVNTIKHRYVEMNLRQVFAKARKIYPKWAVLL